MTEDTRRIPPQKDRRLARRLAAKHAAKGDPLGWFEALYATAGDDTRLIPWGDMGPNPNFVSWPGRVALGGTGKRALQIGCGLGDDAEYLAGMGFDVTAFDIAPTAVRWCRRRFADSAVRYEVANLFATPAGWERAYDFVLEVYTLQSLPRHLRAAALWRLAGFVVPGGDLLIIGRLADDGTASDSPPWPLMPSELRALRAEGLRLVTMEDYDDEEHPPVRRVRAHYTREA